MMRLLLEERIIAIDDIDQNDHDGLISNHSKFSLDSVYEQSDPDSLGDEDDENDDVGLSIMPFSIDEIDDSMIDFIFEDLCFEVLRSEYVKPSVPDCILETFQELFNDELPN